MPINLTKGQKVDLTKDNPNLTKIIRSARLLGRKRF